LCGDGVVGDGADCANARKAEECDMTGFWVEREVDFQRDRIVNSVQTASTWHIYRFSQTGTTFQVEQDLECGVHIAGAASVDWAPATLRGLIYNNEEDPQGKHGPRHGTFTPDGQGGCVFTWDRWYYLHGAVEATYLPADFSTHPALADLPALPDETNPVHPTGADVAGATDPDGDGLPGAAYRVTGPVSGVRESVEREYKEYATPAAQPVQSHALEFVVPAQFGQYDWEMTVLAVTQCGTACSLLAALATVAKDLNNRATLSFVGHTLDSDRVASVLKGNPRDNIDADLTTCANARLVLPPDTTKQ
jgi:hypothetical protein